MGPADIPTQHDSTAADSAKDSSGGISNDSVAALIEAGNFADCLSLLKEPNQHGKASKSCTLRLICQTCLRSQDEQWWQVCILRSWLARQQHTDCSPQAAVLENPQSEGVNSSTIAVTLGSINCTQMNVPCNPAGT